MTYPVQQPLQAIDTAVGAAGADPRVHQLTSLFQGSNDGPAKVAAKLTGLQQVGKPADDAPVDRVSFQESAESWAILRPKGYVIGLQVRAHFLRGSGVKTPVFVRFSTDTFGREFPDSGRNPRGMAIKFYTGEGTITMSWALTS
ncbi:hypothetical protein ACJ73_04233 [Blastomyces percursus]|uniref:Catalase core domain-containing protein n=1 Tax=Blastomyces percursus TaxID=1658174 RepID=A0A1J9Q6P1_9EURO|nr:hypothetical protein ACJ73_04233 [Blastomyces percursus]